MASNATSSSFSFSSFHPWIYDVFLNFRGMDTRDTFVAHLHGALKQKGFNTFIDDRLQKGEEVSLELLKAIKGSRISIVVLSPNYVSSSWCLNELLKIIECKEKKGQVVLPVFYHVDPSDIRKQANSVGDALAGFKDEKKVEEWKIALKKVADLSGFHHIKGNEYILIQKRVLQQVLELVQFQYLDVAENPVGIESRVEDFLKRLDIGKKKIVTHMVGIWGDGGIGKTTIAKAIYNSIAHVFEGACFLADVRETTEKDGSKAPSKHGLVKLQNKILSKILGNDTLRSDNVDEGIAEIQRSLYFKKILLILDDVNHLEQLKKLAGKSDWFGLGSVIIITTRDKSLLTSHMCKFEENFIYNIKNLDHNEALQLFNMNAFKTNKPDNESLELANEIISYVGGLPLALTVLGSALCGKDLDFQKEKFKEYRRIPNKDIQTILEFSYNNLEESLKDVFLDIACFFKGMPIKDIEQILSASYSLKFCVKELEDKSLIKVETGELQMHDLIQDMAKEIVRKESSIVGERSRLWLYKDVRFVLEENAGTSKIKGILIDLPEQGEIHMDPRVFNEMKELRIFINLNARIFGAPKYLSNKLSLLKWPAYPGKFIPSNFRGAELVDVRMPKSKVKSLESFKNCQSLKRMDFSKCGFLKEIPDFSGIANLRELDMGGCENLVSLHPSVGCLEKLVELHLVGCFNLRRFPTVLKMRSLRLLCLSNCTRLENFPEFQCPMESLEELFLENTGIEHLPSSFQNLAMVGIMILDGCEKLKNFPSGIVPLQSEYKESCSDCSKRKKFSKKVPDNRQNIEPLKEFETSWSTELLPLPLQTLEFLYRDANLSLSETSIVSLPTCIQNFLYVSSIFLEGCMELREIVLLPHFLRELFAGGCDSLERFSVDACNLPCLEMLNFVNCHRLCKNPMNDVDNFILSTTCVQKYLVAPRFELRYPGNEIPDWFIHRKEASSDKSCEVVINELANFDEKFIGFAFCTTYGIKDSESAKHWSTADLYIDLISGGVEIATNSYERLVSNHVLFSTVLPEGLGQFSRSPEEFVLKWDDIKIRFRCESEGVSLLSCGVHLLRSHEENSTNRCTLLDRYVLHNNKYVPREEFVCEPDFDRESPQVREHQEHIRKCLTKIVAENLVDSIDGTRLGKTRRDDEGDDNLKSNYHPQNRRRSLLSGVIISDAEDEPLGESQFHQSNLLDLNQPPPFNEFL